MVEEQWKHNGNNGHYNVKATNVAGDTCFLSHFARRRSFDRMTTSNLAFDWGSSRSSEIRSNFQNSIKKHMFLTQSFLRISNMALVFFHDLQNSQKLQVQKWRGTLFATWCYKDAKKRYLFECWCLKFGLCIIHTYFFENIYVFSIYQTFGIYGRF